MKWYVLAFGPPLTDTNSPVQRHSPDVIDKALTEPGLAEAPSAWRAKGPQRTKGPRRAPKKRRKKKRRTRRPGPHLYEGPKTPTDSTSFPRPSPDGAT